MEYRRFTILVSSPVDVGPERLIAERVIRLLAREFAPHLEVEPVLWEAEPLAATEDFQAGIPRARDAQAVILILWSRLGVPLSADKYLGAISQRTVTGTEWEF